MDTIQLLEYHKNYLHDSSEVIKLLYLKENISNDSVETLLEITFDLDKLNQLNLTNTTSEDMQNDLELIKDNTRTMLKEIIVSTFVLTGLIAAYFIIT